MTRGKHVPPKPDVFQQQTADVGAFVPEKLGGYETVDFWHREPATPERTPSQTHSFQFGRYTGRIDVCFNKLHSHSTAMKDTSFFAPWKCVSYFQFTWNHSSSFSPVSVFLSDTLFLDAAASLIIAKICEIPFLYKKICLKFVKCFFGKKASFVESCRQTATCSSFDILKGGPAVCANDCLCRNPVSFRKGYLWRNQSCAFVSSSVFSSCEEYENTKK